VDALGVALGVYAAIVATAPLDCPLSLYPVNHLSVGTEVCCPACNRKVGITLPVARQYTVRPWCGDFTRRGDLGARGAWGRRAFGMDGRAELRAELSRPIARGDRLSEGANQTVGYAAVRQA
jgi:hypothetical protein